MRDDAEFYELYRLRLLLRPSSDSASSLSLRLLSLSETI